VFQQLTTDIRHRSPCGVLKEWAKYAQPLKKLGATNSTVKKSWWLYYFYYMAAQTYGQLILSPKEWEICDANHKLNIKLQRVANKRNSLAPRTYSGSMGR
jgi:hypothetical protein